MDMSATRDLSVRYIMVVSRRSVHCSGSVGVVGEDVDESLGSEVAFSLPFSLSLSFEDEPLLD